MTTATQSLSDAARRWRAALTSEEIASLKTMHDWRSYLTIAVNWGIVFGAMARVAGWIACRKGRFSYMVFVSKYTWSASIFAFTARKFGCAMVVISLPCPG